MRMRRQRDKRSVYVIKNDPNDVEAKHKELQTKSVYLLKADDHVVTKHSDTVYNFVDQVGGLFYIVSPDRSFYQFFRKAMYKEFRVDQERIHLTTNPAKVMKELKILFGHKKYPLIFLEGIIDESPTLPLLEEIRATFKNALIIVLMNDSDEQKIANYVEAGADNFITKPVSVKLLIEKVANTLLPPDKIGRKVREGKMRLAKVEFALAYGVARDILQMKPGSPAGLLIMGDALKGLSKREDALKMYLQASENADMYLEPLKKIVTFYKEEEDTDNVLRYLLRIDELSPLHVERKREIGEIYFSKGEIEKAAEYFESATKLMHKQRRKECVDIATSYADRIFDKKEAAAEGLLSVATRCGKAFKVEVPWSTYNRLGMLKRRNKDWTGAIKAYTEASLRAPKDASILFNLGMAYVEGKDFSNAAEKFERAINLSPALYKENLDAGYIIGQVFIRAHRLKNAAKVLTHIHDTDPNYKKVKALLASIKDPKSKKKKK